MTTNSHATHTNAPLVVGVTGASGAVYAARLLQFLSANGQQQVHLTISPSGQAVIQQELGLQLSLSKPDLKTFVSKLPEWMDNPKTTKWSEKAADRVESQIVYHHFQDYMTPIASGSFRTSAMVICPCSGSTLSAVSRAAASNLVQRAAEVHLKEQRKLVLVPRETPLSVLQLENMHRLAAAGAVLLPAMPGWYHDVTGLDSIVDFVVSRILDQIDFDNALIERWKDAE